MRDLFRRLVRLSTLGLVGRSPKNQLRHEQARLARAQRKATRP